jgi:peptidoglycan/xylan/chitin deacetylase (PgdA/CDA1 family)
MLAVALKRQLKNTALRAARTAGVFDLCANSARRRDRLMILCYHGIALRDEHLWRGGLFISPDLFRSRMELLRTLKVSVLPLGEALERLRTHSLPQRSVAITFDDGFWDFRHLAAPIMKEFGYPSTLYLTTHYCDYRMPIFNLVTSYMLWLRRDRSPDLSALELPAENDLSRDTVRDRLTESLNVKAAGLNTVAKDELAQQLAELLNIDYDDLRASRVLQILSPEEAGELSQDGIDLQLHTHRHRTPRDHGLFVREIKDNAAKICQFTGRRPTHFCYPSGVNFPEFLPWLTECGVESATTCELGLAKPDSDPLLLPRLLDAQNIADVDFESWVCGFRN